jgi:hypothetical protein
MLLVIIFVYDEELSAPVGFRVLIHLGDILPW